MLNKDNYVAWLLVVAAAVVAISGGAAQAGALDGHALAFNDGAGPAGGAWTGSTAFDNGTGVAGYVDWAVFGPGDFPYTGYAPTIGELVYTYQVFSTGTDALSEFFVALDNPADNIGSFSDLSGDLPTGALLVPPPTGQVAWQFSGIVTGDESVGLAFSSLYVPMDSYGVAVDGGTFAAVIPLPSPSQNILPEPITLSLLAAGAMALVGRRPRNRHTD